MKTLTKGNVVVEDIKVGDIQYEFEYGLGLKSKVVSEPVRSDDGVWTWTNENLTTGERVEYAVDEKTPSCYSVNLYNYKAYTVLKWI